jgi:catechol 2,3-dioxygenase-like lactoylglutathione lyase family enzyme
LKALGLAWIGVFPVRFDDTVAFLCDVAGLSMFESEPDAAHLVTARGDMVEVFRPEARYDFATTGPIPGFLVEDVEVAIDDLRGAAVELLGSGRWRDDAWQHFRAPDGFVYEVKSGPYDPSGPGAGLAWAGARSPHAREMADFAEHVLGMQRTGEEAAMVHLRMPNGDGFEVFLPEDTDHAFMHTGPVVAFGVEDLDAALAKLDSYRAELFMGGIRTDGTDRWVHFRAPDGCVYELFQRG